MHGFPSRLCSSNEHQPSQSVALSAISMYFIVTSGSVPMVSGFHYCSRQDVDLTRSNAVAKRNLSAFVLVQREQIEVKLGLGRYMSISFA